MDVESKEMELSGAGERDLGKWKDRFLSIDEVSLCEIQEVPLAAVKVSGSTTATRTRTDQENTPS